MPARKLRLEVLDSQGNRYTITCEGNMTKDKILHILDLAELVGGASEETDEWRRTSHAKTKFENVHALIERRLPIGWFSSYDVQKVCQDELHENLGLSTISTYLLRLTDRGYLMRKGASNQLRYKLVTSALGGKADIVKNDR
jgi:hypothetical protein